MANIKLTLFYVEVTMKYKPAGASEMVHTTETTTKRAANFEIRQRAKREMWFDRHDGPVYFKAYTQQEWDAKTAK
jgi:hypothetical protein